MALRRATRPSLVRAFCFAPPGSPRSPFLPCTRCPDVALLSARSINHAAGSAGENVLLQQIPKVYFGTGHHGWKVFTLGTRCLGLGSSVLPRSKVIVRLACRGCRETAKGLASPLDCGQELQYWQRCRSPPFACGAGAQDISAVTLYKSAWPIHPSFSALLACEGSSGKIRRSSYASAWRRSSSSATALEDLGDARTVEQLWEEYFAGPFQWWDNRVQKRNPRSPDFQHKVTGKGLWIEGRYTPAWVKGKLKPMAQVGSRPHAGYGTRYSQDLAGRKRQPAGNTGKADTAHESARVSRNNIQSDRGSMPVQRASTVSGAVSLLKDRLQQGFIIDSYMYVEVLKRCLKQKDLTAAKQVHDCIIKSRMDQNTYVANNLLSVYIKCGRLQAARRVLDALIKRDVYSFNIMIGGYGQHNHAEDAMGLFNQMCQEGVQPNEVTYLSILKACARPSALEWGKEVHEHIRHGGFESDVRVGTALVKMYAKCGCIKEARQILDNLTNCDVFSWNVMIGAYAESGFGEEAYGLFLQMKRRGFKPDVITYMSILNTFASLGALDRVKEVHSNILEAGLELDLRMASALVHMYAKSGSIDDARLVFDRMEERDVVTWSAMIGAYAGIGRGVEAYELFLQMQREGCAPNAITFISILNVSASSGALDWVKQVHGHILEVGLESDLRVGSALVHMYAKSSSMDDAQLVSDGMEERDVMTWNVLIGGLAQHGRGYEALEAFGRMNAEGVKPDAYTFVAVLSGCSHAGLVDEGRHLFLAMSHDYGIEPTVLHYACMVDLVGRAGHLEEAKLFIRNMPVEPDKATWGALLGACRTYGNVELGEVVAKEVLKLEPHDASAYVLLSNIYAGAGKWDMVSLVRTMMHERGIRKEPGRCWIEVDNKTHDFVVGDLYHPEAKQIYAELNRLIELIKAEGYIPDTRLVLKNMEEEDKEESVCSHSEKLAIAYGLMHIPHGKPIRVYKNLRVCSDCHTATKFISKVTGREIVARDANRFHHFKDGVCSCGDYW